ncbi:NUDIX hydrolase [Microbacterium azadirachtae]|uniref:ADP-ribose pyrophosphatase n=1 Tax=Microbacterium azadirachtae TaxID=582680 RepID=A0A0F0KQP5_9MICO|nr:NUDIX hydrolase [Microbacterium azadirachtae]KJL21576.1 ADP-ribose pyrophosphatase [Microbacterium azadirachtae]UXW84893.1 NUDIX hydrolase [Microbacterium azadirachtae]SDM02128.1 ADP-ribose pyrophosphatase [Microbacterium azadirachtae]SEG27686.1 ADP-ribose pyrophosphatase [Microbacterium azadirachtae]SEG30701.1 ADP-ribose pyrophosphatase [Microbacterium azadirachtae]
MSAELAAARRRGRALSAAEGRAFVAEQLSQSRRAALHPESRSAAPDPSRRSRVRPEPAADPRWRWISTRETHRGRVRIDVDEVQLPTGERTTFEVDRSVPFTVAVLVQDGADLLLARQYRYPIDRWILDLPGGAAEFGEVPEQAARRELEEELGLVATELIPLHRFFANPGRSVWATHLFFATGVRPGRAPIDDPSERVELARIPRVDFDQLLVEGEITDPTLLIARTMAAVKGLLPPIGA